jgi:hypothetical protein
MQMTCHPSQWTKSIMERGWLQADPNRCSACAVLECDMLDAKGRKRPIIPVQCSRPCNSSVGNGTSCLMHHKLAGSDASMIEVYPSPDFDAMDRSAGYRRPWNIELINENRRKRAEVHNAATKISACWRGKIVREQLALHRMLVSAHQQWEDWATEPQEELETVQEDTWSELEKRLTEMSSLVSSLEERLSHAETDEESEEDDDEYNEITYEGVEYQRNKGTGEILDSEDFSLIGYWDAGTDRIEWEDGFAENQHKCRRDPSCIGTSW